MTGSKDRTARVWDAQTGETVLVLKGHIMPVNSVAFSPDGQQIVTGSGRDGMSFGNGEVKVWDVQTGREILAMNGDENGVDSVTFSPDGRRIITASGDLVKVWFSDPKDWSVAINDTNQANIHLSLAEVLVSAKKYEEAAVEYRAALQLQPALGNANFWGSLGWYEYLAGHMNEAIKSSRNALEKDPTLTYVRLNLGLCYATVGDWSKAQREYDLALKAVPKANLKDGIDDVQDALKKHSTLALEKTLVYLRKAVWQVVALSHGRNAAKGPVCSCAVHLRGLNTFVI